MPPKVDEVEKIFMELKKLINYNLPKKLGLLAVGITIISIKVLKISFVSS